MRNQPRTSWTWGQLDVGHEARERCQRCSMRQSPGQRRGFVTPSAPPHRAPPPGPPRLLTWPRPGPQILPPTLQTSPHPRKRQNSSAGNMDEENEMACAAPGLVSSQNASGPPAPPQPCPDPDCISAGTVLLLSRVTMLSLTLFPLATITIVTKAAIRPTRRLRQINIVLGDPLIGGRC